MKVTDEQYKYFRDKTNDIREAFDKLEGKIGRAHMTIRFIRSINNMIGDMQQMYFDEIRGAEEKKRDRDIVELFQKIDG